MKHCLKTTVNFGTINKGKMMTEMPDFMRGEGEKLTSSTVQDDQLKSISELAERIAKLEETITLRENIVKNDKAELRKLTDEELPSAMQEIGMKKFETASGYKVDIKKIYAPRIKVEDQPEAYQWLRNNGHGDIIKNTVSINFGKGEDETAQNFKDLAEQQQLPIQEKTQIHPQTLKAWGKEQIESGRSVPDIINIMVIDHAKITGGTK
jgi:hypothetical protein